MAIAIRKRRRTPARPGRRLLGHDRALGARFTGGADEAGRGALAGPLVTAAVLLDHDALRGHACAALGRLDDSKKLTLERREQMLGAVLSCAVRVSVIVAPPCRLDERGLHRTNLDALAAALRGLDAPEDAVLLSDGFRVPLEREHTALVGGDGRSAAIAAASIVAKVTRDRIMRSEHPRFPDYGFDRHVGYATSQHRRALDAAGPCAIHRRSFLGVDQLPLFDDDLEPLEV
jgi:ribonuclease HII